MKTGWTGMAEYLQLLQPILCTMNRCFKRSFLIGIYLKKDVEQNVDKEKQAVFERKGQVQVCPA
jgi:hypothetical protein